MDVAVGLDLCGHQSRLHLEGRPLDSTATQRRQWYWRALADQRVDRRAARTEVDLLRGRVSHRLDRPALHATQALRDIEGVASRRRWRWRGDPSYDSCYCGYEQDE